MLTPAQVTEKHSRNLKNSSVDIENGIKAVTVSPTIEAAKKADKMVANLITSVKDGKWKRGLEKVSLSDWQKAAIEVGVPRIAAGIDAAQADVQDFYTQFLPFVEKVQTEVRAMKDLTLQDNIQRMIKNATRMSEFKRT